MRQGRGVVEKVMVFTDVQLWNSRADGGSIAHQWAEYRRTVAPEAHLYLFDLAGHGTAPLEVRPENGVASSPAGPTKYLTCWRR